LEAEKESVKGSVGNKGRVRVATKKVDLRQGALVGGNLLAGTRG